LAAQALTEIDLKKEKEKMDHINEDRTHARQKG